MCDQGMSKNANPIGMKGGSAPANTVTYNGVAMNLVVSQENGSGWSEIYYLDNVTTAGDIVLDGPGAYSF